MWKFAKCCVSFTSTKDWIFRCKFHLAGLKPVTTHLRNDTVVHCWVPRNRCAAKPSLMLIHGFGANAMWQYSDLLRHITPYYNVYVPDLLFFGGSYTAAADRTEFFQARCMVELMAAYSVTKLSLVGVSYGGFVGYHMAERWPEMVEKVVLCCTGVCLEERDLKERLFKVSDLEEAEAILLPQSPDKLRELMRMSYVKPITIVPSCILADFIMVMCTDYLQEKRELIHEILKDRKLSNLPKINQKTLIVWGEEDQIFPLELGYRLKRHIGENAEMAIIKDAGHALNLEKPKEFTHHLKEFLIDPLLSSPTQEVHSR